MKQYIFKYLARVLSFCLAIQALIFFIIGHKDYLANLNMFGVTFIMTIMIGILIVPMQNPYVKRGGYGRRKGDRRQ